MEGHDEILRLLMNHGYPIDKKGVEGFTVLHHSAWNNKHSTVRMLIKDFNGKTVINDNLNDSKDSPCANFFNLLKRNCVFTNIHFCMIDG